MTTQNTPGDGSHPDIPGSNNGPTIGPIAVRHRSTWLSPAHRYRVHPAWPQEGGAGPNFPLRGPLKSVRGAVPKQQPRERERGSSYSARRDNVDNAMPLEANPTLGPISGGVTALTGHGKLSRRVCVARPSRGERRAPLPAELGAADGPTGRFRADLGPFCVCLLYTSPSPRD